MKTCEGVIPIVATPFNDDESLDLKSLANLIRFYAKLGVEGVTILGVLGEASRLTDAEREMVIDAAVQTAQGRLPVIVGVSHPGTEATIEHCRVAERLGAAAAMVAPSPQPVPRDQVVFDYYQRVAAKTNLPLVVQDHPASTQVHMSVELLLRLAKEIPAIICIKAEAVPSPSKIAALKQGLAAGRPVTILTGLGALYGLFDLECGSDGFNTGFAFPEVLQAILGAHKEGKGDVARELFTRHLPLIVFEQQPGVAIRKEILRLRGLIASNRVRHPGAPIDPATAGQLKRLLDATFPSTDLTKPLNLGL
ncbi:MAG: dihydrodipicolinate synthase family protein [Verrucomicrobiota bacterium]